MQKTRQPSKTKVKKAERSQYWKDYSNQRKDAEIAKKEILVEVKVTKVNCPQKIPNDTSCSVIVDTRRKIVIK